MSQPTPSYIQLPPNSTGLQVDCVQLQVAGQVVNRENGEVATPVSPVRQTFTEVITSLAVGATFAMPAVSAGKTGYLARIKFASTGACQWTVQAGATVLGYTITGTNGADVYEPPHRFYDQCPALAVFSVIPTNLTSGSITVYATIWYDQF